MEQQLKQQLMQKKLMQISRKKKESTVFSILPFVKIVPTIKKKAPSTIISKKSHTHFNMISNHQRTVLKLFMKKEKCMRKSTKKTLTKSHQFI